MQTKKRKMKMGEALVGMKRRGSQLEETLAIMQHLKVLYPLTSVGRTSLVCRSVECAAEVGFCVGEKVGEHQSTQLAQARSGTLGM